MKNDILREIWPEWQITKVLGKGSFGTVYEAVRKYDISKKTEPISVDVNVSEVSWLRIELRFYSDGKSGTVYTLLSDFELHK